MPSFSRNTEVSFMVLQSDRLPMTTPTTGYVVFDFLDFIFCSALDLGSSRIFRNPALVHLPIKKVKGRAEQRSTRP
jgi:hypothetical protein